jgi:catechol 2,3-dioxygenase-like lactoylglutathione lyase family enzyme
MAYIISGIQQIGIGVANVHEAFAWYRRNFGMDIQVFEEAAEAALMLPYTGGKPRSRHAILALNLRGGGGMEIWQYTSRTPQPAEFEIKLGDLGLYAAKIKCSNIPAKYHELKVKGIKTLGEPMADPGGNLSFWVEDPYGNLFQLYASDNWFVQNKALTGGPSGCVIGVSDIEKARAVYTDLLGYDQVIYDETGVFKDFAALPGGGAGCRRVLLTHSQDRKGPFSRLMGQTQLELIQLPGGQGQKIFKDRMWGDLGFIHLCFDIQNMDDLRQKCQDKGYPFTVDSASALGKSFDMGEAAGLFSYIEDPDGTLIEFVETHKVPIAKKLGWYLNLRKRNPEKPLPNWMLKAMRFNRVKD